MAAAEKQTAPTIDTNALAAAIAQGIATIAPRKELKEGDPEYVARQHAEGWYDTFDNGVTVFQNAYEAQPRGLSPEVRQRAAHLKPGKYLQNRVTVTVENDGAIVRLSYPVKGDNLLKNQSLWRDFSDLINQIWQEMQPAAA